MIAALAAALPGCHSTFLCETNQQCNSDDGQCEASGYCSFDDDGCGSGRRYGSFAPEAIAGTCVPVEPPAGTTGSTGGVPSTQGQTSGQDTGSATVSVDGGSSTGSADTSTDTGFETVGGECINGCNAGCPNGCANGQCEAVDLGGPGGGEGIGVVIVGSWVVWSTGTSSSIQIADLAPDGMSEHLQFVSGNDYVTNIVGNETHAYFLDYGGPRLNRISIPDGEVELVAEVGPDGQAGFSGLALTAADVYFGMTAGVGGGGGGSTGLWRAAIDLSQVDSPDLLVPEEVRDVVVDDTYVYWTNTTDDVIARLPLLGAPGGEAPEVLVTGRELNALAIRGNEIFFGDADEIRSVETTGSDRAMTVYATGQNNIWDIATDDLHVYWTANGDNTVMRAPLDTSLPAQAIANSTGPLGLELSCETVYWVQQTPGRLHSRLK